MVLNRKFFKTNLFSAGLINALPLLTQTVVYLIILRNSSLVGLGEYFMIMVFISFISLFMDLGISTTVIKYLSEFNQDSIFVKKIIIWQTKTRILLGFFILIIFLSFKKEILYIFTNNLDYNAYLVAIFSTILISLSNSISPVFIALNKLNNLSKFQFLNSLILVLCVFLCVYNYSFNIYNYSIFLLLHSIFSFFLAVYFLFKENLLSIFNLESLRFSSNYLSDVKYLVKISSNSRSGKSIFRFLFNISIGLILAGITSRIDMLLINKIMTISDVGVYGFFLKFVIPISVLSSTIITYISPQINKKEFSLKYFIINKIPRSYIYIFFATMVLYCLIGVYMITFFLRNDLLNYSYFGSMMALFSVISLIMNPFSLYGYNYGLDRYYPIGNILQLLVVYIIYTFLVSKYGLSMAVIAYGSNFVLGAIFLFFLFRFKKQGNNK